MFNRSILLDLATWASSPNRKPLLLRGARQVGKTSVIRELGRTHFKNFLELNLEDSKTARNFRQELGLEEFVDVLKTSFKADLRKDESLLFIDEIQEVPWLIGLFRFFYERMPKLAVIGSGSLLEIKLKQDHISIPVGRIENRYMFPLDFYEHLEATGETETLEYIKGIDWDRAIPETIHHKAMELFHRYCVLGGMPEVTQRFADGVDAPSLEAIKGDLFTTYLDDVRKYAVQNKQEHIEHVLENAPFYAGKRFSYEKFAGSRFRSDQMKIAFDTLSSALLLHQAEATDKSEIPIIGQIKRQKKLAFLDVGLVSHRFGLSLSSPKFGELTSIFRGQIAEQVVAQHLVSWNRREREGLFYWAKQSTEGAAEVDFIFQMESRLIAIEVKSGIEGKLRSLLSLGREAKNAVLCRVYSGRMTHEKRDGRTIHSLPFYLIPRIRQLLGQV